MDGLKVGINGLGTVGGRLATVLCQHPVFQLVGATKVHPDYKVRPANCQVPIFTANNASAEEFKRAGVVVAGTLSDLLAAVDVIIDCTPAGTGSAYVPLYADFGVKAVFQGGEPTHVAPVSFFTPVNLEKAKSVNALRIPSCNETGLLTIITTLQALGLSGVRAGLVRRAADLTGTHKGQLNAIEPKLGANHYASGIRAVIGNRISITAQAVKVSTTLMHAHLLWLTFDRKIWLDDILALFRQNPRILLVSGKERILSTADVTAFGRLMRPHGDIYEVVVWEDSLQATDDQLEVSLIAGIHQEAIVIPGNLDALWALSANDLTSSATMGLTNRILGIKDKK